MDEARSEGVHNAFRLPSALSDDVEPGLTPAEFCVRRQPGLGSPRDPPHLLARDHLERVATLGPALRLHLAEDDRPAAAENEVELVASRPGIRRQDPVPAQPVVPLRPALRARPDRSGTKPL